MFDTTRGVSNASSDGSAALPRHRTARAVTAPLRHVGRTADREPDVARRGTVGQRLAGRAPAELREDQVVDDDAAVPPAELLLDRQVELASLLGTLRT
jgi:hypothetical protein